MSLGFIGKLSDETISKMLPGDVILTQRLDAWKSWLMMYLSSSAIDHAAIYIGDGKISHVTLAGTKTHSVHVLGRSSRMLVFRLPIPRHIREGGEPPSPDELHEHREKSQDDMYTPGLRLSPKVQLALVGLRIVAGFHPRHFRWKFSIDLLMAATIIDGLLYWAFGFFGFVLAALPLLLVVAVNQLRFAIDRRIGRPPPPALSHPDLLFYSFRQTGALVLTPQLPLVMGEFGLLTLAALRALVRESPENGSADQFKDIYESFLDLAEGLDIAGMTDNAEQKQRDQDYDKKIEEGSYDPRKPDKKS